MRDPRVRRAISADQQISDFRSRILRAPASKDAVDELEHKFIKSGLNAKTERRAHDFVLLDRRFQKPDARTKRRVLELFGAKGNFTHHSFDLVMTDVPVAELSLANVESAMDILRIVEVKSTRKAIQSKALNRFFFGSSETQYELSAALGDRALWAFVVLNDNNEYGKPFFTLLSFEEVKARTRTKRVQFQVNFASDTLDKPDPSAGPFPHPEYLDLSRILEG